MLGVGLQDLTIDVLGLLMIAGLVLLQPIWNASATVGMETSVLLRIIELRIADCGLRIQRMHVVH